MSDSQKTTQTEEPEHQDVLDKCECEYDDEKYSEGAVSCQNGREFICQSDGSWAPTGGEC